MEIPTHPANRAALVTGAARRVGRAIAEDLARDGWAVAIHYGASGREADELAKAIGDAGGRATTVQADLSRLQDLDGVVERASEALGPLTLLVNNASIYESDSPETVSEEAWHRQLSINLAAPVFLTRAFVAQVPEGTDANIVNLLDPRIYRPSADNLSYQISKAGLAAATQVSAKALAPNIRVNGIAPGPVLPSVHTTPERYARRVADLPLQRAPGLEEFGRTVRYFVGHPSITGQIISLDSGQHLV